MITVTSLLQNHGLSRLIRFVSRFTAYLCKKNLNKFYLVLHPSVEIFDVTIFLYLQDLWSGTGTKDAAFLFGRQ